MDGAKKKDNKKKGRKSDSTSDVKAMILIEKSEYEELTSLRDNELPLQSVSGGGGGDALKVEKEISTPPVGEPVEHRIHSELDRKSWLYWWVTLPSRK